MRLAAALMLSTTLILGLPAGTAMAHSKLQTSTPANGATAKAGLSALKLVFSEAVRPTLVWVTRAGDKATFKPKSKMPAGFVKTADVTLEPLAPGQYRVNWTAVAKDGHVMTGAFGFVVSSDR